jgi:ankyrin repeat protein
MRMYSTEWQISSLHLYIEFGMFETLSLSRLHKSVLHISSEDIEEIGQRYRAIVDEVDFFGRTALYWAALTGQEKAVEKLLFCGADPGISDANGATPLHAAVGNGSVLCINALIASGANLDARDRFGAAPLHHASAWGQTRAIRKLLDYGADCESRSCLGETPLYFASHMNQIETIHSLVSWGASLEPTDSWGYPLILDSVLTDSHESLEYYITQNVDLSVTTTDGKSVLHVAALNSDLRTIELLLNADFHGLNTYALDNFGYTALEYARQRKESAHFLEIFYALVIKVEATKSLGNFQSKGASRNVLEDEDEQEDMKEIFVDALESLEDIAEIR